MGGQHHHHHEEDNIATAFFLNLVFAIIEFIGGVMTNSVAIVSDAIHDLGDSLSLGIAWYFEKLSHKKKNRTYSFGFKRFSVLGALINAVILSVGSVLIIVESIKRLMDPVMPEAKGMIYLAILGVVVNGLAAFKMMRGKSQNERVVYLHLLEDVLGWVATLLVGVILLFVEIPILDPILSLAVAVYILYNVVKNLKTSVNIVLQATPDKMSSEDIHQRIKSVDSVIDFHDCHLWTMDGLYHVLSGHVVVDHTLSLDDIAELKIKIKSALSELKINHITLEFETPEEDCKPC